MDNQKKTKIPLKKIRDFSFENIKFILMEPSASALREAKFKYHKKYTQLLKEGFYTKPKLVQMLADEDGNLLDDHSKVREDLMKSIVDMQKLMDEAKTPEEIEAYAQLVSIYRNSLLQEDQAVSNIFASTVEQLSEDERVSYLTYAMVRDENGNPFWTSYDDFLNEDSFTLVEACKYEVLCWEYNLSPNWQESLPEAVALKKAAELRKEKAETKTNKTKKTKTKTKKQQQDAVNQ